MDLAIAAALLTASGQLEWEGLARVAMVGRAGARRLGPAGPRARWRSPRRRGRAGRRRSSCRPRTAPRRRSSTGIEVVAGRQPGPAAGAGRAASGRRRARSRCRCGSSAAAGAPDLADLRGQPHLRYALEVAAAGGHSLLMVGPPGAGKSLAASRLPSILPPLAPAEALEVARIASACGRLGGGLPGGRPFRAPHHTISAAGLVGGGNPPRAGRGDAGPPRRPLPRRALRVPARRAGGAAGAAGERLRSRSPAPAASAALPCRFMLVAAANPCPCGRGEADPDCTCAPLDGPALPGQAERRARRPDRHPRRGRASRARRRSAARRASPRPRCGSGSCAARERQERRLGPGRCNAEMTPAEARECALERRARPRCSPDLYARQRLSGRAHDRVLRLAQTIADLAGSEEIGEEQMAQALQLRRRDHELSRRACPDCLRRSWLLAALGPYIEKIATGELGLALAGTAAALQRGPGRGGRAQGRRAAAGAGRGAAGGAAARRAAARPSCWACCRHGDALPGRAARRRRRALGADRPRRPARCSTGSSRRQR